MATSNDYLLTQQVPAPDYSQAIEYDFRFARQGALLRTSIQQESSQIVFRPDYLVRIEKGFIRLDGVLTFGADPSQIFGLELIGGKWSIDYVTWDKGGQTIVTERNGNNNVRISTSNLLSSADTSISRPSGTGGQQSFELPLPFRLSIQTRRFRLNCLKQAGKKEMGNE